MRKVENIIFDGEIVNPHIFDGELKVGMKVHSEQEAYDLYNKYALNKGFSIRKGNRRLINGICWQRELYCSKQGINAYANSLHVKKFNHLEIRTDCKARIRYTIQDGFWIISHFNDDHNHDFANIEERCNLRSGRKIISAQGIVISSMVNASIKPIKSYSYLAKEVGGANNVGFTERDCHNFIRTERKKMICAGDSQSIIAYFKYRQMDDSNFFYSVQVDE